MNRSLRLSVAPALVFAIALFLIGVIAPAAEANNSYPSDSNKPNLTTLLEGMNQVWESPSSNNLHGTVKNAAVLAHSDELAVWINNHSTAAQRFKALQDANYTTYQVASDGLGGTLGAIYLKGLKAGELPLTNALLGNITGYVGTEEAKNHYSFPRPYLRSDTSSADSACNVGTYNASSLKANREGKPYAEPDGDLKIERLPDEVDNTGKYVATGTTISAGYSSYCGSGSFPSGHTTGAYLGDVTLATLLPELAPAILARASEQGNNRIVLGVHYPLDIVGGRMDGEIGVAARWSDAQYRHDVLLPARAELVAYLEKECGGTLAECIAHQTPYEDNPYNGAAIPGGTAQIVNSEQSALSVYTERLAYSFPKSGTTGLPPAVPTKAANLLITTFPTLTPAQRTEVLAQTEIESGYPLDVSSGEGSWQRLNLAASMSAKVELAADGTVHVAATGGAAEVVSASASPTLTAPGGAGVAAGEKEPLVGAGFTAGAEYEVVWAANHAEVLGTFTAAADGSGEANVTIPVTTGAGAHTITVLDSTGAEVLAAPLSLTVTTTAYPQSVTTTSPDGKTIATVFVNSAGELGYTVAQDGLTVVKPSRLGLVVGGADWGKGVTLGTATPTEEDTTYPLIGTHSTAINDFKGNIIPVEKGGESKLGVEIRVFDTGIAFRYDLNPSLAGQTVSGEDTTYAFDPSSEIAYQPYSEGTVDDLQGDTSQEVLSALGTQKILELPTLTSPDGSEYTNIAEANVRDWPALSLETKGNGQVTGYYWATDNGQGTFNVSPNTLHSPFRVLTVADNLTSLVDSDIIGDVNAPLNETVFPGGDTTWIKPGVSAWESLNASVGQGQTVSVISNMIKNASEAGMPEVLVEGQMVDSSWGTTTVARYTHLKELVEQGAHELNPVKVWLWSDYNNAAGVDAEWESTVNYSSGSSYAKNSLQNPDLREAWMNLVKSTGVVGIKIDHIGNETETKVDLYADVDKAAAERHLMVEFHNPLEPTGLNRTYPNEVGREAIRGVEINYAADQDTDLPFTRYVDGTADYTPLLFSNASKQNNATWAHEVASTVLYTNPYLQISENPANLKPGGVYHSLLGSLVENVPTTWRNTTVLPQSELGGRLAGVVRETESGEYWIAVVATPGPAITTQIPLSFLPEGKTYNADVYADKKAASSMSRTTTTVEKGTTLKPTLQSGGGYLVRITEEAIENPGGGEGEGTTYEISNESELAEIREHPAATFLIKANITMTHPWTPVQLFSGTIDGNGHTISGLNVEGEASKAFVIDNQGTIQELGFLSPKSVVPVADPTSTSSYTQTTRVGIVAVTNDGLIESVYTKGADVEGGWRGGPIAAENNGEIRNVYTVNSKVVGNWEVGGTVGWNSATGSEEDSYVATANITSAVSNGGIFTGYGYSGTKIFGDVVYSGALKVPTSGQLGRVLARENGAPSYEDDLSLNTATINGAVVSGGAANNKNGKDTTEAELQDQSTYEGIGWNFDTKWAWDPTHKRPVLTAVPEVAGGEAPIEEEHHEEGGTYTIGSEADLALLREHIAGTFNFTANITMTHPWAPIPDFKGTIDGHGHTITGLEVTGGASQAFININTGTISRLGFIGLKSIRTGAYEEPVRVGGIVVINGGTIEQVYTKGAEVAGGWRTAPIAAMNEGTIANSYTVDSKVTANWESGAISGWNSPGSVVKDDYVAGAEVDTITSNGGILSGYGYVAEGGKAATLFEGDVVYSGALTVPAGKPQGRINGQEHGGSPTYVNDLSLNTATISGAVVSGGAANNRNGKDATEAELQKQSTYEAIGWDFSGVWVWSEALKRPVLHGAPEEGAQGEGSAASPYLLGSEAGLELIREHPEAHFKLTGDITMTHGWTPIPTFSGVLDGAGHTISGLEVEGSVPGSASKAFIGTSSGTIERIGFTDAKSIITAAYAEPNRAAIVAVINTGTMREVFTEDTTVEGGWRGAPLAANNEGLVTDSYSVDSTVHANWESGGLVAWNQVVGVVTDSYVLGSTVTADVSSGGIFTGYTYAGTKIAGNVVISGALTNPNANQGRILARENSLPTMLNNLSSETATINGAVVTGGAANNRNGKDASEAELKKEGTYVGIGWDFEKVWVWSPALERPVLRSQVAAEGGPSVPTESATFQIGSEADLELLRAHPDANFELTANITMTKPWKPLPAFGGTLDGNGHTITGLEPEGEGSKAFIVENSGTIEKLGFIEPKSIIHAAYTEANRVAAIAVINAGTIDRVYTKGADIEGGWRTAPIAANNEGKVTNSYTVGSKVVSNYESGALVGWNFVGSLVKDDYVAGANVTDATNNSGILAGYGWAATNGKAATVYEGNVVYSGALTMLATSGTLQKGRIDGQEKNGSPTYVDNLASSAATINGAAVTGGLATNKNGQDASEAELTDEATYAGIGWDFAGVWRWSSLLDRPVLRGVGEAGAAVAPVITAPKTTLTYQVGAAPSDAELIAAAEATTSLGALTIDTGAVHFDAAGEYTAELEAENEDEPAVPVPVTIKVVAPTTISVARPTVQIPASATTPIAAADVIGAAGASANNGATVTADVSAVESDVPGSYQVTLTATDPFGFTVASVTVTVEVTAAATRTSLAASASSQVLGTATPVTLTATVTGGDGSPLAGTVELFDGATEIATAPLGGGEARFTLSGSLAVGDHPLTAKFVPSAAADAGSESDPDHVTVTEPAKTPEGGSETTTTETKTSEGSNTSGSNSNPPSSSSSTPPASSTPAPPTTTKPPKSTKPSKAVTKTTIKLVKGKHPELTIKVTGAAKSDGKVEILVDSKAVKTITLKNGTAEVALPLKKGTHKVKAIFAGDSSLKPSTSPTLRVTVTS